MKPFISVIVCTYNRAELLKKCLDSLLNQSLDHELYEVVIVDNNSTDGTNFLLDKYVLEKYHFRVVLEKKQGITFARNRGWKEACGQYIAYIDDDAQASENWLSEIYKFTHNNPNVAAFGGKCEIYSDIPIPKWFPAYGSTSLGDTDREIDPEIEYLLGTNCIFRRVLLEQIDGFNENIRSMSASKVAYGEDTEILIRLKQSNINVFYASNVKVFHYISHHKMQLKWLLNSVYQNGQCHAMMFRRYRKFYSHIYGLFKGLVSGVFNFCKPIWMPWEERIYVALNGFIWELGSFKEYLEYTFNDTH
jgi:glucosyl-dolichyl phosphate glucuronosyltransferase